MDVIFRKATLEDVESIINLCNECFEENTNIADAKKIFRETESDVNNVYLVGEWQKKLVAHAKITVVKTMYEKMGTYAILNHVCVAPSLRRKKIATKMLDEISKMCQKKSVKQ